MTEEKIFDVSPGEQYEDDRSRFTIFFQVLGRKFWKLISLNFLYILLNLPAIIISFVLSALLMEFFMSSITATIEPEGLLPMLLANSFPLVMLFMVIPALCVGPAQAGLTYILRCFSYEVPVFMWSDFKDKMKENLKQSLLTSLINLLLLVFLLYDLYLYSNLGMGDNLVMAIANGLLIVVLLIFTMMNLFIYPMMVTYKLKLKDLYKNAFLFAFARFLPNLGVLLLAALLVLFPILIVQLTGNMLALAISYGYYIVLGFSLPGYVINYLINPVIDRYIRREA